MNEALFDDKPKHRTPEMGSLTDAQVEQVVIFDLGWYTSDGDAAAEHGQVRAVADAWADPDCTGLRAEWTRHGMPESWLDECMTGWFSYAEAWLLNGRPYAGTL